MFEVGVAGSLPVAYLEDSSGSDFPGSDFPGWDSTIMQAVFVAQIVRHVHHRPPAPRSRNLLPEPRFVAVRGGGLWRVQGCRVG